MPTLKELQELKTGLQKFHDSDLFGLGEMEELKQIKTVIELVDGAIINISEE